MDERTIEWLTLLARALFGAAALALLLSVIAAVAIAGSESSVPGLDEVQRENRGVFAIGALGAGLTASGVLAGIAGIIRLLLDERERTIPPA